MASGKVGAPFGSANNLRHGLRSERSVFPDSAKIKERYPGAHKAVYRLGRRLRTIIDGLRGKRTVTEDMDISAACRAFLTVKLLEWRIGHEELTPEVYRSYNYDIGTQHDRMTAAIGRLNLDGVQDGDPLDDVDRIPPEATGDPLADMDLEAPTKLRLLLDGDESFPVCESFEGYEEITLAGVRILLHPNLVIATVARIRAGYSGPMWLHGKGVDEYSCALRILRSVDGLRVTLSEQGEVAAWAMFASSFRDSSKSLWVDLAEGVGLGTIDTTGWTVTESPEAVEGEVSMRLEEE